MKKPKCNCNGKTMRMTGKVLIYMPDEVPYYTYAFKCDACNKLKMVKDERNKS